MRSGSTFPLVALVILDGWGIAPPGPGNAVELASTPVFDQLWAEYPHATLAASGEAVGLPPGQMGNSEVGHLTIGAGRVLDQDFQRVNRAIADGTFFENEALVSAFRRARERDGDVHLLGLVSYGGVHSHIDHLRALHEQGVGSVLICPVGFVSDHLEIRWDLDVEAVELAKELGLSLERIEMPNNDPAFVRTLAGIVKRHLAVPSPA